MQKLRRFFTRELINKLVKVSLDVQDFEDLLKKEEMNNTHNVRPFKCRVE